MLETDSVEMECFETDISRRQDCLRYKKHVAGRMMSKLMREVAYAIKNMAATQHADGVARRCSTFGTGLRISLGSRKTVI